MNPTTPGSSNPQQQQHHQGQQLNPQAPDFVANDLAQLSRSLDLGQNLAPDKRLDMLNARRSQVSAALTEAGNKLRDLKHRQENEQKGLGSNSFDELVSLELQIEQQEKVRGALFRQFDDLSEAINEAHLELRFPGEKN